MHILEVMKYGDRTWTTSLDRVPDHAWEMPGACGSWAPKEILAHLASYELLLTDVLQSLIDGSIGQTLSEFRDQGDEFNTAQVAARSARSVEQLLGEYSAAYKDSIARAEALAPALLTRAGVLDWYGTENDLEDYVVYSSYGHKREHSAQINAFVDLLQA